MPYLRASPSLPAIVLAPLLAGCPPTGEETTATDVSTGSSTGTPVGDSTTSDPGEPTPTSSAGGSSSTGELPAGCEVVEFPDPALDALVRESLGALQGPLSGAALADLSELSGTNRGIADLRGLECAVGLLRLHLPSNAIADLSPLAGLPKLERLELNRNLVVDLSPLAGLPALRWLDLSYNSVIDLSPLADTPTLELLEMPDNPVESLEPLAGLTKLQILDVSGGTYLDLEPLAGLTALTRLGIGDTAISDLGPLSGLSGLESLFMNNTDVTDLSPLSGLPIRTLWAVDGLISDIAPVAGFPTPTSLKLTKNAIADIDALLAADWSAQDNEGGCGQIHLDLNPLSDAALEQAIPALCASTGLWVVTDAPVECAARPCPYP